MRKNSKWVRIEGNPFHGYAILYIDGARIDLDLCFGHFTMDADIVDALANENHQVRLAEQLEEFAATLKDAAKQERERLKAAGVEQ